jgi:hypothetical protein
VNFKESNGIQRRTAVEWDPAEWERQAAFLPVPKGYDLPTRRTKEGEKTIGGSSLRWNRLIEVYLEVDNEDDDGDDDDNDDNDDDDGSVFLTL